jgi:hypothetical protein
MRNRALLITILMAVSASVSFAQNAGPVETVKSFYKYSKARSDIFDRRHVESRKQWYTPALYRAFQMQLRKDRVQEKKYPTDKPFFGDGLDFSPLDEPCETNGRSYHRSYSVSGRNVGKTRASVSVKFAYPKACTDDNEPIYYKVSLWKINGKWLIADWTYPDGMTLTREMRESK